MENEEALAMIIEIKEDRNFDRLSKWAQDFIHSVEEQMKNQPWRGPSERQEEKLQEIKEQL